MSKPTISIIATQLALLIATATSFAQSQDQNYIELLPPDYADVPTTQSDQAMSLESNFQAPPASSLVGPELDAGQADPIDPIDPLTRGPMHEAFGTSVGRDLAPGRVVPRQPPTAVNEIAPATPEELANQQDLVWISGYWAWDEERNDFLWISGAWRIAPEGREWHPGYWSQVARSQVANSANGGWQWTSGFWKEINTPLTTLTQRPPASLEAGPSYETNQANQIWRPGNWVLNDRARTNQWQWQPGSYCDYREHQIWVPAQYIHTPRGCMYVSGYWDYPLQSRGCLYAPVYFEHRVATYRPSCQLQLDNLLVHLFVNKHDHHYYFGDYYDVTYRNRGCYPIYDYRRASCRFDPLLTYYTQYYSRRGVDCHRHLSGWHRYYASHVDYRPRRTLSAQLNIRVGGLGPHYGYSSLGRVPQNRHAASKYRDTGRGQGSGRGNGGRPDRNRRDDHNGRVDHFVAKPNGRPRPGAVKPVRPVKPAGPNPKLSPKLNAKANGKGNPRIVLSSNGSEYGRVLKERQRKERQQQITAAKMRQSSKLRTVNMNELRAAQQRPSRPTVKPKAKPTVPKRSLVESKSHFVAPGAKRERPAPKSQSRVNNTPRTSKDIQKRIQQVQRQQQQRERQIRQAGTVTRSSSVAAKPASRPATKPRATRPSGLDVKLQRVARQAPRPSTPKTSRATRAPKAKPAPKASVTRSAPRVKTPSSVSRPSRQPRAARQAPRPSRQSASQARKPSPQRQAQRQSKPAPRQSKPAKPAPSRPSRKKSKRK